MRIGRGKSYKRTSGGSCKVKNNDKGGTMVFRH